MQIGDLVTHKGYTPTRPYGHILEMRPETFNDLPIQYPDQGCIVDTSGYTDLTSCFGKGIRWCYLASLTKYDP